MSSHSSGLGSSVTCRLTSAEVTDDAAAQRGAVTCPAPPAAPVSPQSCLCPLWHAPSAQPCSPLWPYAPAFSPLQVCSGVAMTSWCAPGCCFWTRSLCRCLPEVRRSCLWTSSWRLWAKMRPACIGPRPPLSPNTTQELRLSPGPSGSAFPTLCVEKQLGIMEVFLLYFLFS